MLATLFRTETVLLNKQSNELLSVLVHAPILYYLLSDVKGTCSYQDVPSLDAERSSTLQDR